MPHKILSDPNKIRQFSMVNPTGSDSRIFRPGYHYRKNGLHSSEPQMRMIFFTSVFDVHISMCVVEEVVRHSLSQVTGQIISSAGDGWQAIADILQKIAVPFGSIVKIRLHQSPSSVEWLNFEIYYDHVDSAAKFWAHIDTFGKFQMMSIILFQHFETPPPANLN